MAVRTNQVAVDVDSVAIPAAVARDLILALSAENVRLRTELKEMTEERESWKGHSHYYEEEANKYKNLHIDMREKAFAKRAEIRRAKIAERKKEAK
jgi:hypothetical protein